MSRAAAHPGVVATLVGSELPIPFGILPVSQDEHALAPDKVRFVGDPVAAVAALDEETAEEALKLIDVDYEVLPALMSIDDALARPDSRIHDYGPHGNVHKEVSFDFGDVEGGFAEADHVREDTFFFEGNTHLPMEQHAAVAAYGPDGKLTLWSSTQTPHYVHRALAKVLEMPPAHVRVIATPERRRLRRQERPLQPRGRGLQALDEVRPAGEDHAHARGGLLLPPRPPPREDVGQDGREEGRLDHGHALPHRARRRAATAATASPASTTRARCRP